MTELASYFFMVDVILVMGVTSTKEENKTFFSPNYKLYNIIPQVTEIILGLE